MAQDSNSDWKRCATTDSPLHMLGWNEKKPFTQDEEEEIIQWVAQHLAFYNMTVQGQTT